MNGKSTQKLNRTTLLLSSAHQNIFGMIKTLIGSHQRDCIFLNFSPRPLKIEVNSTHPVTYGNVRLAIFHPVH